MYFRGINCHGGDSQGFAILIPCVAGRNGSIPPDICATRFFDREDPDKKFMMEQIQLCPNPEATLRNFNSWALYHPLLEIDWEHTGFYTYTRSDFEKDTREEMLSALAKHFGLG